ncbi:uncharacterized protein UV8b_01496 [Ustilaginoidea virens]|uniref:Infection structure specific protein n=1 Tax=Ustilaginoidea virens TaxID=1159556 RepID=A0A1B5KX60_USTVR|nr:uncharacterized protein UV8b_01496 [Ustilaginoidea virens]QUC17255.1 hypothetical protein UV8b_01496 [Ustilaginoidea virens]GAO15643.1 hypothetical protein UVI_02019370 [Ustilaginoidea virens]
MYTDSKLIILAALAATALSSRLQPRQTADLNACLQVIKTVPTPPPAILSVLLDESVTATDACSLSVPSSLSGQWASYTAAQYSWYKANEGQLKSNCAAYSEYLTETGRGCSGAAAIASATGSAATTPTSSVTGTATGTASTTPATKTNGAARDGGVAAAALAVGLALAVL